MAKSGKKPTKRNNSTRAPGWCSAFIASLRECANITVACKAAGIDRSTAYARRNNYPDFALLWDEALDTGADVLEAEAWRRAAKGVLRPVYQGGVRVGVVREFSDTLMCLLLKGHAGPCKDWTDFLDPEQRRRFETERLALTLACRLEDDPEGGT